MAPVYLVVAAMWPFSLRWLQWQCCLCWGCTWSCSRPGLVSKAHKEGAFVPGRDGMLKIMFFFLVYGFQWIKVYILECRYRTSKWRVWPQWRSIWPILRTVSTRFFITSPSFPPFQMKLRHPTSLLIVSISLSQMIFIAQKLTVLFRRLRVHVMGNLAI